MNGTNVQVKSGEATIDDVIAECLDIWHITKTVYRDMEKEHSREIVNNLHKKMITEHHDLATAYPAVLSHIVYCNKFYPSAAKKYFEYIKANPWKSKEDFLDRQAVYSVFVRRHEDPRVSPKEISRLRQASLDAIKAETKKIETINKEITDQFNKDKAISNDLRRERILKLLQS